MKRILLVVAAFTFSSCAFADSVVYAALGNQLFGTIDLNTGSYTQIGSLGYIPAGLGEIGNTLYTGVAGGTTLYSVNASNGSTTAIGSGSISFFALGSTNTGLYTIDQTGALYSINPTTGATTLLGSTGINVGSNFTGISAGSSNLYVTVGQNLYSINPSVGTAATLIGNTGIGAMGALVSENGTLFGSSVVAPNAAYTLNLNGGNAALLSLLQAPDYAYGLAPDVPEPSTVGLLGFAGILSGVYAIRRRRIVHAAIKS